MTLLIIILVYILSVIGAYKFIQLAHYHEKGRWISLSPEIIDLFVTFCPLLNSVVAIQFILGLWKSEDHRKINFLNLKPMTNFLIECLAYFFLWIAIDQGREEKIKFLSKDWWIVFILMVIASLILKH